MPRKPANKRNLKVLFLPAASNPYQYLLAEALAPLGVEVEHRSRFPSERWLVQNRGSVDLLHIHWLHQLYAWGWKTPLRFGRFVAKLCVARSLGYKIVWTMHNVMPHERTLPGIDLLARLAMVGLANAVIVHCEYARQEVNRRFRRKHGVHVITHGNYALSHSESMSRQQARRILSIGDDCFVYLCFGRIRPYKGVEGLVCAFRRLDTPQAALLIAGDCHSEDQKRALLDMTSSDRRIRTFLEYIPDEAVPQLFAAADVVVAPFREVLTSGSVILGLTFGRPIVAPERGCLPELIGPQTGILYDPMDGGALLKALEEIQRCDVEMMGHHAYRLSQSPELDWSIIASETRQLYLDC
jgi:beta-1,4-mannosyltransferase